MTIWLRLFSHQPNWHIALPAVAVAVAIAWTLSAFAVSLLRWSLGRAVTPLGAHRAFRPLYWILRVAIGIPLTIVLIPPALEVCGQPLRGGLRLHTLADWTFANGLRSLVTIAIAVVLSHIAGILVVHFEAYLISRPGTDASGSLEQGQRARTLGALVLNVVRAFIVATAALMVLGDIGINTAPLLTSAGIVGLAIGFGAQTLVHDVISGFFIIFENQVRVGDIAEINGAGGLVEAITLRTIVVRDLRGAVHIFPCGSIATLANLTKDYAFAVFDVQIPNDRNPDDTIAHLRTAADQMRADPAFGSVLLEGLQVLGVEAVGDAALTIRVRVKTVPQQQWKAADEFRRRVAKNFQAANLPAPVVTPVGGLRP